MNFKQLRSNKKLFSWALYDWANSSFATTVMAGFFPVFFKKFWSQGVDPATSTAQLGYVLSFTSLIVAFLAPISGAYADAVGQKKSFLLLWAIGGAGACIGLGMIPEGGWQTALWVYGIGMIAFNMSLVFYDGLIHSVATESEMDMASSVGYALGYLGGGVLFLLNVLMYLKPAIFGLKNGVQAVQISFMSVGIWWTLFSFPLWKNVPEEPPTWQGSPWRAISVSLKALANTFREILGKNKNLGIFLLSYWLFIDGVYTVITMAVDFGIAIGLESQHLIAALLLTQFIGFPCAWAFGFLAKKYRCKVPILICIGVYSLTVILATQMTESWHFFLLAVVIGVVQGGVQALTRSLFGRMVPAEKAGEYFGFFNLVGKFASILGPLIVGVGTQVTGSNQMGLLGLLILFGIGGGLFLKVKEPAVGS